MQSAGCRVEADAQRRQQLEERPAEEKQLALKAQPMRGNGPAAQVQVEADPRLERREQGGPVGRRLAEAAAETRRRDTLPHAREAFLGSTQGLLATYLDRGPERPWALARQITAPTLLVYGRQDKLVNPRAAHRAAREFGKAHVMVIPDSGHVAQMEHPELVARWWREFLG